MKRPPVLNQKQLQSLGKDAQHGYLLRVRHAFNEGELRSCPFWLAFLQMAYFDGLTEEIEGTPTMSLYREVLIKQSLH